MEAMLWRHDFSKWLVRCFQDMNCKTMNAGEEEKIERKISKKFQRFQILVVLEDIFQGKFTEHQKPMSDFCWFQTSFPPPLHLLLEARCCIIVKIMVASFLQILRDFCPTIIPGSLNVESSLQPHRLESCLMHSEPMWLGRDLIGHLDHGLLLKLWLQSNFLGKSSVSRNATKFCHENKTAPPAVASASAAHQNQWEKMPARLHQGSGYRVQLLPPGRSLAWRDCASKSRSAWSSDLSGASVEPANLVSRFLELNLYSYAWRKLSRTPNVLLHQE